MKWDCQKPLKKLTLFFLLNLVPFNGQVFKNKRGLELVTSRLQNKFTKKIVIIFCLTKFDGVKQSSFWVIWKITPANLCKPIHDFINYSISICPFESGKCGTAVEELQKFEYLEYEKSFLDEIKKTFFIVFEGLSFGEKRKNLIKNSGYKL